MKICFVINNDGEDNMPIPIPERFLDLLHKPAFGHLATIMPDGSPQVTPVWYDYDGTRILINSAKGRVKDKNMRRNPKVAIAIMDPENPYRYLEIRGSVTEITEAGAEEHIDLLAKKYLNLEQYPNRRPGETRVIYRISPEHISSLG